MDAGGRCVGGRGFELVHLHGVGGSPQFHVVCLQRRARIFPVSGFVKDPPPPIPPIAMSKRPAVSAEAKGGDEAPPNELCNQPVVVEEGKVAQPLGGGLLVGRDRGVLGPSGCFRPFVWKWGRWARP